MGRRVHIGVLAFHGDVEEHMNAMRKAAHELAVGCSVREVRTREDMKGLDGLIIPGGESTVLHKLAERASIFNQLKQVPHIFGTCAGAIMLAKRVRHAACGQETLALMDIEVDRNAYGRQAESFERDMRTSIGSFHGVFIRAPRIIRTGKKVRVLARVGNEPVACEETKGGNYYLACCFHPELRTTLFHVYFLKKIMSHRNFDI